MSLLLSFDCKLLIVGYCFFLQLTSGELNGDSEPMLSTCGGLLWLPKRKDCELFSSISSYSSTSLSLTRSLKMLFLTFKV